MHTHTHDKTCTIIFFLSIFAGAECFIRMYHPYDSVFAVFDPEFILEPRDMTVLRGEPYSVECFAAQNTQQSLTVTIRDLHGLSAGNALTYTYPDNEGFPVYRVESATLEEPGCYYCDTRSQPYDTSLIFGSKKSMVTVHGEQPLTVGLIMMISDKKGWQHC